MWRFVHLGTGAHRGQKRALEPLELKFQVVVGHVAWRLATKLWSFVRGSPPNCPVSSPALG